MMFEKPIEPDRDPPNEKETQIISLETNASHVPATSGTTLLPRPVASLVSLLTQSTSLSLRVGTFFGGVALDGARATTLTGLELGRAVIEGILTRAGRDVAFRSGDEHGRREAESLLERSLATLHTTVTSASFFAAASFHFSSTTLASVANFSQALLSTLDAILGSTESSRAIAAIITLIRREFRSVDAGASSEKIGVGDLFLGSVGFALLQRWGKKNTERTLRQKGGDEVVWDTVILDSGLRADVVGTHQVQFPDGNQEELVEPESASFVMPGHGDESFDAVHRRPSIPEAFPGSRLSFQLDGQQQVSDEDIRSYIMSQLPPGCHATIKSEVLTARTITVDIFDDDIAEIAAPPGTTMIEERFHHDHEYNDTAVAEYQRLPKHTVVFRTAFNKSQSTELRPRDGSRVPSPTETQRPRPLPVSSVSNGHAGAQNGRASSHPEAASGVTMARQDPVSPGSTSDQSQKSGFGKGSFTKLAKKVKSNGPTDSSESTKRAQVKKPALKPAGSSSAPNPRQPTRPTKGAAPVREATARETSSQPEPKRRHTDAVDYRPSTPAPNRGLRRSPYPHSPQSPQSPRAHPRHVPPRNIPDRSSSRAGYFVMREKSQESLLTHTDTFSRRNGDLRPGSPVAARTHVRSSSSMSLTRSEADGTVSVNDHRPTSSARHGRSKSYTPSMYSVATAGSETSLLLAHRPRKSAYEDMSTIQALNRDGLVPGIFPERHFVQNIRRFCRFSSASYGANALKVMGVPKGTKSLPAAVLDDHEHSAFSDHAGLPPSTILLSSFVDPAGGTNAAGETESGVPLVHYLSIDHESKAVVLTLRGTWGFEDILTDMTCDYDDLEWQGKNWKVHKGMHASAKRLLEGGGGRVMITLRAALEEFQDYGVVLCGHSLGGGVAALLATMIAEPSSALTGTSFVTASYQPRPQPRLITVDSETSNNASPSPTETPPPSYDLPPGRPIHVYAYGPPAVMSPFLRLATRGLITTIVNGSDIVPSLSLGILHDMHTAATLFKSDISGAKSHVRQRLHESLRQSIIHKFYVNQPPHVLHAGDGVGEDAWAWKTLGLLRDEMRAPKLMPPGEVFVVETMRVLQREAFTAVPEFGADGYPRLGRPATRVQMRFVRDVDAFFGELRFASGMLSDHNPARYETSLAALARGVLDE
ncbi:uncharacterized protein N7496_007781 [Penicillium cataractarum]|uniref:sn-1-specific diacylglycerol lipase n=1 Tax=Penicillium cataractarum TaxID=2100454 RepID=A0A9W9V6G9_9EURO|nr:uncharacterized protein N7496_007781 [Penicillium cataractarum]KAJ5368021.1 hypothetical protein N7496_007781 [Penicillium cataractarum]